MGMYTPQKSGFYDRVLKKAEFSFSRHDFSIVIHKLDAPHLVLVAILSCALVVGC